MNIDPALAIAISVALHVCWNLLARRSGDALGFMWWGLAGHLLWALPSLWTLAEAEPWRAGLAWWLAISSVAIIGYLACLGRAYQLAPAGVVYPLARSSPVPIAIAAGLLFGLWPTPWGWLGIAVSVLGLLLLSRSAGGWRGPGVAWALAAAAATTAYALSDRRAALILHGAVQALAFVTAIYVLALLGLTADRLLRRLPAIPPRPPWPTWLAGSLCIGSAYALVIHAMRRIPPAEAVAFTNAGIVIVVFLGIVVLGERTRVRPRLLAVAVIVLGLVMLALGGQREPARYEVDSALLERKSSSRPMRK